MFRKNGHGPNYLMDLDNGCYISYNPAPCAGMGHWSNGAETALVNPHKGNDQFLIVDTDAREEYEKCTTYDEAFKVFEILSAKHGEGKWSRQ